MVLSHLIHGAHEPHQCVRIEEVHEQLLVGPPFAANFGYEACPDEPLDRARPPQHHLLALIREQELVTRRPAQNHRSLAEQRGLEDGGAVPGDPVPDELSLVPAPVGPEELEALAEDRPSEAPRGKVGAGGSGFEFGSDEEEGKEEEES